MKKLALAGLVIIVFIAYAIHQNTEGSDTPVIAPSNSSNTLQVTGAPGTSSSSSSNNSSSSPYKDGTYTGSVADAFYGNIQVKTTIQNGKISDVQFLQHPSDQRTSQEINNQAMPYLKQEAIQSQNAQVQTVSGATQSSQAFVQSLQSALDQAKG